MSLRSLPTGLATLAVTCVIGCGPKPVVKEHPAGPAADVTVTTETAETTTDEAESDAAGVDVQVGGGQGVQVEVDTPPDGGN